MNTAKLKSDFHKLIDTIDNETILKSFMGAMSDYVSPAKSGIDIIDELTDKQQRRLKQSLEQGKTGKIITNEQMKKEIRQWLAK